MTECKSIFRWCYSWQSESHLLAIFHLCKQSGTAIHVTPSFISVNSQLLPVIVNFLPFIMLCSSIVKFSACSKCQIPFYMLKHSYKSHCGSSESLNIIMTCQQDSNVFKLSIFSYTFPDIVTSSNINFRHVRGMAGLCCYVIVTLTVI